MTDVTAIDYSNAITTRVLASLAPRQEKMVHGIDAWAWVLFMVFLQWVDTGHVWGDLSVADEIASLGEGIKRYPDGKVEVLCVNAAGTYRQ